MATPNLSEGLSELSRKILHEANRRVPRIAFLREILKMLVDFTTCRIVELRLLEGRRCLRCRVRQSDDGKRHFHFSPCARITIDLARPENRPLLELERLTADLLKKRFDPNLPFFTANGSFFLASTTPVIESRFQDKEKIRQHQIHLAEYCKSFALFPLTVGPDNIGLIQFWSDQAQFFNAEVVPDFEQFMQTLSVALLNQRAQAALTERVKELTCLYGIARVAEKPQKTVPEILEEIVLLLPPAWQYPEITAARIILDGKSFSSPGFIASEDLQSAPIIVRENPRGQVEVVYLSRKPHLDEGPFLYEERSLIEAIAREISLIVERKQSEEERNRLQDQLRHADRLATIGQLAAGVAHELNEPLANILGFAQLVMKNDDLSEQVNLDVQRIIAAALHAREVIKKLMFFGRPAPPQKMKINLNQIVSDGIYFLESRCAKEGIELIREIAENLPEIVGDRSQLHQVLVNLIVNAIQAMPHGGKLTLKTNPGADFVALIVKDTGTGMTEAVKNQIFIPFFTTKDVGEGTGIGLSVVHGIVKAHGGKINVESEVGVGTKIEIQFPLHQQTEQP